MGCLPLVAENKRKNLPLFFEKTKGRDFLGQAEVVEYIGKHFHVGSKILPPLRIWEAEGQGSETSGSEPHLEMNRPPRTAQDHVSDSWEHGGPCP